jgi:hypothetical protein
VPRILPAVLVPVFSGVPLYLLYRRLVPLISDTIKEDFSHSARFVAFMKSLLVEWGLPMKHALGTYLLYGVLILIVVSAAGLLINTIRKRALLSSLRRIGWSQPAVVFLMVTLLSCVILFVYRDFLGKSLGVRRNNVWMIPLVFLCVGILIDRFCSILPWSGLRRVFPAVPAVLMVAIVLLNFPSFHGAYNRTCSKRVLDRLREINPEKVWVIRLSRRMRNWPRPFYYYNRYGYKTVLHRHTPKNAYDVTLWYPTETPDDVNPVYLDKEFFLEHIHLQITVNNPKVKELLRARQAK